MRGTALLRLSSITAVAAGLLFAVSHLLADETPSHLLPLVLAYALWVLP
ncbi:MAG: hypothetical protein ABR570_06385 [Burkholderiales bacterium]